jgi:hypothetical protein
VSARDGFDRRLWWQCFALIGLASIAWALTTPLLGGPDEGAHAVRAAAVARGEITAKVPPGSKDNVYVGIVKVPEAYKNGAAMTCYFAGGPHGTPACAPSFKGNGRLTDVTTGQQRGSPYYYAIAGFPTLAFPSESGVYLMRFVTALVCAAFVASAFVSVRTLPNRTIATVGLFVALTPMVLFLFGVVNSNSLEIAAGICLWATMLALTRREAAPDGRMITRAGIAFVVLTLMRGLSPAFSIGIVVVALLVSTSARRRRELWQRVDVHRWVVAGIAAVIAAGAWIVWATAAYPLHRDGSGLSHSFGLTDDFLRQSVGVLSWRATGPLIGDELGLPIVVYVIWAVLVVALIVAATMTAPGRHVGVLWAVMAVGVLLPLFAEGLNLPPIGVFWQGRHGLPLLCGVPILAATLTNGADRRIAWARRNRALFGNGAIGLVIAGNVIAFAWMIRRAGVGYGGTANPISFAFNADWTPPTGPAFVHLALFIAAMVGLAFVATRGTRRDAPAVAPEPALRSL